MPTDYKSAVVNRVWALLEGYAPFTSLVISGNRLKMDAPAGWFRELVLNARPTDLPRVAILPGRFTSAAFTVSEVFANEDTTFVDDGTGWVVERGLEIVLEITNDLPTGAENAVEEAAQIALLRGGPKLGLQYVLKWGPLSADTIVTDAATAKGVQRLVTKIRFFVTLQLDGQTLVNQ